MLRKTKEKKKVATETFLVKLLFRNASDRSFFSFSPRFAGSSALKWVKCEEKEESPCCRIHILCGERERCLSRISCGEIKKSAKVFSPFANSEENNNLKLTGKYNAEVFYGENNVRPETAKFTIQTRFTHVFSWFLWYEPVI